MARPDPIWLRRPRGERKRRPPSLSREKITHAAIRLADEEGLDAVTTRRLAAALGAGATSIYWHVASKQDLYDLMVDEVIGEIDLPEASGAWEADLRLIAHNTLAVLRRHDWFAELGIQPGLGPKTQHYARLALDALEGLTDDLKTRVNILAALNNYLAGFVQREAAWTRLRKRTGLADEEFDAELRALAATVAEQDETTARQMRVRFALESDESLGFGLDCFVSGVARLVHEKER